MNAYVEEWNWQIRRMLILTERAPFLRSNLKGLKTCTHSSNFNPASNSTPLSPPHTPNIMSPYTYEITSSSSKTDSKLASNMKVVSLPPNDVSW